MREGGLVPYIENPKTKGSGIVCCIPQTGRCPRGCADCFFQSDRSYLEPLGENTPNMPNIYDHVRGGVVRVNDGNDSNHQRELVLAATRHYERRFYNTSSPDDLEGYGAPVVLTVNPGEMTDVEFHGPMVWDDPPKNLMFARVRTNTWNRILIDKAVQWFTMHGVPVVLTFMTYWRSEPLFSLGLDHDSDYTYHKRTLNSYWAITNEAWRWVMHHYQDNPLVHSCGSEEISTTCRHCGNCLREYHATVERMRTARN